ncbi:MAG: hypothetical protein FJX25_15610 [Alphaproteobacteria bacterium]|nr:hypothetical protein [Alphaproteobacteria bacterium]
MSLAVQHAKRMGLTGLLIGDAAVADGRDRSAIDAVADPQCQHPAVGQPYQRAAGLACADRPDDLGTVEADAILDRGAGGGIADRVLRHRGDHLRFLVDLRRLIALVAGGCRAGLGLGLGAGARLGGGTGLCFGAGIRSRLRPGAGFGLGLQFRILAPLLGHCRFGRLRFRGGPQIGSRW